MGEWGGEWKASLRAAAYIVGMATRHTRCMQHYYYFPLETMGACRQGTSERIAHRGQRERERERPSPSALFLRLHFRLIPTVGIAWGRKVIRKYRQIRNMQDGPIFA